MRLIFTGLRKTPKKRALVGCFVESEDALDPA